MINKRNIKKIYRFTKLYGFIRTLVKYFGRRKVYFTLPNFSQNNYISIVGCGQFSFSTIS